MRVYGQGFGPTAVEITVTANGIQVFNGPVPTLDQPLVPLPWPLDQSEILFSKEIPMEFQGTVTTEIIVNSGSGILFEKLSINYVPLPNPVFTSPQFAIVSNPNSSDAQIQDIFVSLANPPFTQEEIDILANPYTSKSRFSELLAAHNVAVFVSSGAEGFEFDSVPKGTSLLEVSDHRLDGNPISSLVCRPGLDGNWTLPVAVGSTYASTLNIDAGLL